MGKGIRSMQIVCFGVFEANLETGELRKNGLRIPLQGQPFQVFAILLEHAGELVSREELRQKVWPKDTFVDFDHALNTAITKIRVALGDDADNPRFVETLPRRGYRFIVPVDKPNSQVLSANEHFHRLTARWSWVWVGAAALVLLSTTVIWRLARKPAESRLPSIEIVPLVALHGMQGAPAFSPDGNQVAFAEFEEGKGAGIYTALIGGEKPLPLTDNPGDDCPTWSPDSRQIAFIRYFETDAAISVIPALGGTAHGLYRGLISNGCLDWSPDGSVIAFSLRSANDYRSWIALLSLSDSTIRPLTSPPHQELDQDPAFSPDGSKVAFARGSVGSLRRDLFVLPVTGGGEPKRLTFDNSSSSPVWTQDGRDIVFSSSRGGTRSLWRISASGGTPQPVAGVGETTFGPSISRKGNQLVYQHLVDSCNIWRINLTDGKHSAGSPVSLISSRGCNGRPSFSPDGKKIVFESDRLGYSDIWQCESDGSNCLQLTSMHGTAGTPRWSPDGHYIAFEFQSLDYYEIYVLEVPGGRPRLVRTFPGANKGAPNWSRDGQWIYFYSKHEKGPLQLWRVPFQGGSPLQVTRSGGVYATESSDGRYLYYSKLEQPGIWRMPLNGGEETRLLAQPAGFAWFDWALAPTGIYFLNASAEPNGRIEFFDFASHATIPVFPLQTPFYRPKGLALSPDGSSLLFTQRESLDSYIMLVKNFR
jgi:Tol biopolymer transport system component/DNA-binding winged helix-turn-helix (wHTH) protein